MRGQIQLPSIFFRNFVGLVQLDTLESKSIQFIFVFEGSYAVLVGRDTCEDSGQVEWGADWGGEGEGVGWGLKGSFFSGISIL